MKKAKMIGKKTLSVFLAVLMVLTTWVWVAPTEASAATAGNYYVEIKWNVNDTKDFSNNFTGTESEGGARAGFILYYKDTNGTATSDKKVYWDVGNGGEAGGTFVDATEGLTTGSSGSKTTKAIISGFPTAFFALIDSDWLFDGCKYDVTEIIVGSPSTDKLSSATISNKKTIWKGTGHLDTTTNIYTYKITSNGDGTSTPTNSNSANGYISTDASYTKSWVYPYANTFTWSDTPEAMTCPETGSDTQTVAVVAKDQYGVTMFNPTWSVKGSSCGTTGISVTTTAVEKATISLTNAANVAGTTNDQTGTVTASWASTGATKTSSKTFTINDSSYTATFTGHTDANGVVQEDYKKDYQHGMTPIAPSAYSYQDGDYDVTFTGWSPSVSEITSDTTYTAVYTRSDKILADYTAVNEALAAANAIKAQYGTDYELKYTLASRTALDSAINAVVTGLGRTQQTTVDGYAQAINDAIAALEPNKFAVIFLDKDGAILLYEKDVEYKQPVEAPEYSAKYYDSTNHYMFKGWDTDEYSSVVDDLVIQPVFIAEAHSFRTETVTSNCVTKGATKYTCSCGYSYIDGESDYGDHVWDQDFTTDIEPTCTVAGQKSIHCSVGGCNAQKDITAIDPVGHQWSSQSVAVEATCGKIGIMAKVCDDCGVCEHTIIDALEHDFAKTTVKPTCTTKGYDEYICQRNNCGYSYIDPASYTDVIDHNYGDWTTVSEALCEVSGVKKRVCKDCAYTELDSIGALQHNLSDWTDVVERTCTGKGYQVKTCSLCLNVIESQTLDALGHNYVEKTVVAPTCTSKGYTIEECNRANCGAQRIVNETNALNHAWTSTRVEADCTHSAYIKHDCANDSAHNYIEYVEGSTVSLHTWTKIDEKAESCTEDGFIKYECSVCETTKEEIIPKLGHAYGEWDKTTNPATNDKDGEWTRECENCNHIEKITIPKGGHDLVEDKDAYKAPKCNEKGERVYVCGNQAHTDCTVKVTVELDFAQHKIAQRENEATCTQKGSVEAYCLECNTVLSTEEISVKAHTPVAQTPAVAPTCTTSGYTTYACKCGTFSYNEYDATKPARGHNYVGEETTAAGCTTEGKMTYTCQNDSKHTYTETIPAKGHSYDEGTVEQQQSCTAVEKTKYECDCGVSYTVITKEAKGHTYGDWEEVTPATADKCGVQKRICACGDVEYGVIDPIGPHNFIGVETTPATCTTSGLMTYTCSEHENCLANYTKEIPANGHADKIVYVAPTCKTEGSTQIICNVCSAEVNEKEIIPVIGYHNFSGNGEVTTEPTCTGTGIMTYTCLTDGCNATKTETIPAKGHVLTTVVTDAKCGEKGSVVTTCANCDDLAVEKTVELAAKGHIWGEYIVETNATCETDGKKVASCTNNDCTAKNEIIIPKLGHKWSAWVKHDPTNTADGYWTRSCSTCGKDETLEIPVGHYLVLDTVNSKAATCSSEGKTVYKCDNHADCGITITVDLPMLQHTIKTEELEATCTSDGYIRKYCTAENCTYVVVDKVIEKTAHNFEAQTPAVAPTCTTSGYTVYKCTNNNCNAYYNVYDASQPAKGHDFDEKIEANVTTVAATCTKAGEKVIKCANCDVKDKVVLPKTGHTYVKGTTTTADCTTAGTEVYTCSCGDTYTKFIESAKGHSWSNTWTVVREATDNESGVEKTICTVEGCGAENFRTTAPIGKHNFTETITTAATCTKDGLKTFTCTEHTECAANYTEPIPATGHAQKLVYNAPTCTAEGSSKVVCSVESCKAEIMSEKIPAKGHAYNTVAVTKEAGCESTGVRKYSCDCGDSYEETIPAKGHDLSTTVNDATCFEEGTVVTKCSRCKKENTIKELPMIEHTWDDGEETTKATCESDGTMTFSCEVEGCIAEKTEEIPALGHDWGKWTVAPSTNEDKGSVSRECLADGCDATETIEIPEGGHTLTQKSHQDSTCTVPGSETYACQVQHTYGSCGISVTVTLPLIQHELENTLTNPTCEGEGSVITKCTVCKAELIETIIPAKGHSIKATVTDATCTTAGSVVEECTVNGCDYEKPVKTLPALGHDFNGEESDIDDATCTADGSKKVQCTRCDERTTVVIPAKGHDFSGTVTTTDATCTADGSIVTKCKDCNEVTTVIIPKLGHTWNAWEVVKEATNGEDGQWKRTCSNNKCTETVVIPAGGHTWDNGTVKEEASCTETGKMVYKCNNPAHTDCGITIEVTIPVKQHTILKDNKEATCTETGHSKTYCSVCKEVFNSVEISVKPHNYEFKTEYAPTCTTSGYTEYKCACGDKYNVYDAEKKATGHKLVEGTSSATCTTEGTMLLSCNVDGCNYSTTVKVPALGHNYVEDEEAATKATCAAAATKTYECSRDNCDASYTISVGDKSAEHTWGDWVVKESATDTSIGYKTRTCDVCGQIDVAKIDATGEHKFIDGDVVEDGESKNATCTEDGYETRKCSVHENCTETAIVAIPATGHTEVAIDAVAATCNTPGSTTGIKCSTCDTVLDEPVEIPALGHLYGDGEVTPATCNAKGSIEYTCSRCSDEKTVEIAENEYAHQYATDFTPATCYKEGSVVTKCSLCGDTTTNETLAKIEHTWNKGEIKENDKATCEADGTKTFTCEVEDCDATKTETVAKLGHDWNDWVKTDATNGTDGEWKRTCKNDANHVETLVIPKGGHTFKTEADLTNPATCTAPGTATYKCSAHSDCGVEITVTLAILQHKMVTATETEVTCDTDGKTVTKCETCDTQTVETTIPKLGHAWGKGVVEKAASCTEEGTMTFTCVHDATHKYSTTIAKLQHNYVEEKEEEATCTSNGYIQYKCETCDSRYITINAPATGHKFETAGSSNATCENGGVMTLECACGEEMTADVPALGHNYGKVSETAATCKDAATETFKCSRCDDSYTVSVGSKTDKHTYIDNWTVVENATESSIGYKTRACEICGKIEIATIEATGEHTFKDGRIVKSEPASCEKNGYEIRECSKHPDCGKTGEIILPALGHTEELVYSAPSCTAEGSTSIYCGVCETTLKSEVISALDHAYEVKEITNSTCSDKGEILLKCKTCEDTKKVEIPENEDAHKLSTSIETEATCTAEGAEVTVCTLCGEELVRTILPMLQHNWGEWKVTTPSTNGSEGEMTRYCGHGCEEKVEIPAGGHEFKNAPVSISKASCTAEGKEVYKCSAHSNCGVEITVTLAKVQHELVVDSEASSCTKAGYVKVTCSECNKIYIDTTFGKLAHSYVVIEEVAPTCTSAGYTTFKCEVCGEGYSRLDAQPDGHKFDETVEGNVTTVPATCEKDGSKTIKCKSCNATTTVVIPKTGHSYVAGKEVAPTCTSSGYTPYSCKCGSNYMIITKTANGHTFSKVLSSTATCGKDGTITLQCEDCTATMTTNVSATGHSYEKVASTSATCAAAATETYKCSKCDAEYTVSVGTKTENHNWNDWVTVEQPDYTSIGYKTRTCKICQKLEVETMQTTGAHDLQEVSRDNPTCTEKGTIYYECKTAGHNCGVTDEVEIPALGHTEQLSYKAASCDEAGYTKITCAVENCVYEVSETVIPALGHIWGDAEVTNSTCSAAGSVKFTCTRENCEEANTVVIPVNDNAHQTVVTTKDATCTEDGSVVTSCELCKKELLGTTLPMLQHNWGTWNVTTPSTNSTEGVMTRSCINGGCNESETVKFPAGGHKFKDTPDSTTLASCTKEGTATYKCSAHANCGVEITVTLAKVQHTLNSKLNPATCTSGGSVVTTCTKCSDVNIVIDIPERGHTITTKVTPATCVAEGKVVEDCDNCDYIKETVIDKLEHSYTGTETIVEEATCEKDGSKTIKCKSCDATTTVVIPKTGHSYVAQTPVDPTCTEAGYTEYICDECQASYLTDLVDPTGHTFDDTDETKVTTVPATCEKDGSKTVKCQNCDATEVTVIKAKGHKYEGENAAVVTAPTCTEMGYTTYNCDNCDEAHSSDFKEATGHKYENKDAVVETAATCETAGYITYNCDNCDETHVVNITPAKGHEWTAWSVSKAATNTEKGTLSRTCQNGCGKTETAEIPAGGHEFDTSKPANTTTGDCQTVGTKTFNCTKHTDCGITITVETEVAAHAWSNWTKVDATNKEDGYWTRKCATCPKEETLVIPRGHNLVEDESQYVAPKCDEKGKRVYECNAHENCSVKITVVLEKIQHTPAVEKVDPSCLEDGYVRTYCSICKETLSNVTLAKQPHNYDKNGDGKLDFEDAVYTKPVLKPDGTWTNGFYTFSCQTNGCEETKTEDDTRTFKVRFFDADGNLIEDSTQEISSGKPATAPTAPVKKADGNYHYIFSGWDRKYDVITSDLDIYPTYEKEAHTGGEATCNTKAECEKCGEPYGSTDASKHKLDIRVEPANCEKDGKLTYYCTNAGCDYEYYEKITAPGHKYGNWETYQNGNCATPFIRIRKCQNFGCDAYEQTESYGAHTWYTQPEVAPTCTTEGYSAYKYCTTCGVEIDSVVIPKLPHRDNNGDGNCDYCTFTQTIPSNCSCMCHSTGFMKFIYTIVRFFWKLFGSSPVCGCGVKHY